MQNCYGKRGTHVPPHLLSREFLGYLNIKYIFKLIWFKNNNLTLRKGRGEPRFPAQLRRGHRGT